MKLFFDESGQTGCVIPNKRGFLYDSKQRYFVLGGILCKNPEEESLMRSRYQSFLCMHGIDGELKGSDMMKRSNNAILNDFIDTMLDDEHFYICCYDKVFYLATLVNSYFYPRQLMYDDPVFYFTQASALTHENIEFFLKFCECNAVGTDEASLDFCRYVLNFDFCKIGKEKNGYLAMAKLVLREGTVLDFPLPLGCYINPNYTNIINITALGEAVLAIKEKFGVKTEEMCIVHDQIKEFEEEFCDTFRTTAVQVNFCDSKADPLLQYADNVASIFRKCCAETINLFTNRHQWDQSETWFPTLYAKMLRKISFSNVKWDMAISDQVLPLCVEEMFSEDYPLEMRNDQQFYLRFMQYKEKILQNIASLNYDVEF